MIRPSKTSDSTSRPSSDRRALFRSRSLRLLRLTSAIVFVAPALAQPPPALPQLPALAQFVPHDVGFFAEVDDLLEIGRLLREQNLWQLTSGLLADETDSNGWLDALASNLGVESNEALLSLFGEQVALAAPDWTRVSQGVIVFTHTNQRMIDALLRRSQAQRVETRSGVQVHRSSGGLWLAIRGSTIALARERGRGTVFDRCVVLLNQRGEGSLAASEQFRAAFADLSAPRLIWAYWTTNVSAETPQSVLTGWWPALRRGALAVRAQDDRIEIALRGTRDEQEEDPSYRPRARLDGLETLPQLTLGAWATSVDAAALFESARQLEPPTAYAELWRMLTADADAARFTDEVVSKVGPRCIVSFGANFRSPNLDPQLALLVESVDAPAVVNALHEHALRIAESAGKEPEASPFRIESEQYLGVTIHKLAWTRPRPDGPPDTLAALIARGVAPVLAALDDWVILATSNDQMHELIDARNGMTQRMIDILPANRESLAQAGSVAVLQPLLAQSMFRFWGALLADQRTAAQQRSRLGISVRAEPLPGAVVIESIDSNGPAVDLLAPGDTIIACDDRLLAMSGALAHLRTMLASAPENARLKLRVLRSGALVEVNVPLLPMEVDEPPPGIAALVAPLAPVENLAQSINCAVLAVERAESNRYRASVTLMLDTTRHPPINPAAGSEIPPE